MNLQSVNVKYFMNRYYTIILARRSKLEIYFSVLEVIHRNTHKPTRIMYRANLSWVTLKDILDRLLAEGFVRVERKKSAKRYFLTDRGRDALSYHLKSIDGLINTRQIM